jgi:hypothetical protein
MCENISFDQYNGRVYIYDIEVTIKWMARKKSLLKQVNVISP